MIGGAGGFLILLGLGLGVVFVASVLFTAHRLRNPPRRTAGWAVSRGAAADPGELDEPRSFRTERVTLGRVDVELWEIDGDAAGGPVVIVSPGWGDSKIGALPRLEGFTSWCSKIVAWDSAGLGERGGTCGLGVSEVGSLRELVQRYASERGVVLYGWSWGGGVSVAAGDADGVVGVIAEAPYRLAITPARNVLRGSGLPWRVNLPVAVWLLGMRLGVGAGWRGFDRVEVAKKVSAPLLVLHGTGDVVSPVGDGREIAERAADGVIVEIDGGGHNDLWSDAAHRAVCVEAMRGFGARVTGNPVSLRG